LCTVVYVRRNRSEPRSVRGRGGAGGESARRLPAGLGAAAVGHRPVAEALEALGLHARLRLLTVLTHLVRLVAAHALALVVEPPGLRLNHAGRLLNGVAFPDTLGLAGDLVIARPARAGAEHVADTKTGPEDQLATHAGSPSPCRTRPSS